MSKAKKLSYDDIISGAKLGVDSIGQDVKHGDTVMYCDDRRGRSAILFGRVVCKMRGNYVVEDMNVDVTKQLEIIMNSNISWFVNCMHTSSVTKVSDKFYDMWQNEQIFKI
ncbi:hypothetical protein ASO1B_110 [Escherichia phage vB_EcoM_ASO1B]|uniref:Phage protein n=6 Tax=Felixounavirus TaxID=1198140 RepID=A0A653G7N7_9CAUD|nr:hypothetical protein AVV39_gp109 [Escherichia phage HY02]EHR0668120.1 hypothetical protein [Escherichia coli]EIA9645155.1 hypothetical protein [Escherichia coli O157]UAW57965.1 hypothetical protein ASO1A_109 [Escherichia phage vB_EcoM_ASO1A]UAW58092.1 hypothetical protein ASO1B_110 [Escherichia phage vB_EcoM_ASO1B]WAX24942.1 hypothetical protein [Escherichia phage vB_EcoM_DE17]WPJ69719.1 hypothetical protein [Escherichia phage vB_EcoM_ULIM3]WPJ69830.1 hypothetical protein [Escherichia pha